MRGILKGRIRQSQIKAAVKVNTELLLLYWDLGQDIVARQMESAWGSGFFADEIPPQVGAELQVVDNKGNTIRQQVIDELEEQLKNME